MKHQEFMHRCLELAKQGRVEVGLNPQVGAVLVRDGAIVGEGWHKGWGMPHAEVDLLDSLDVQDDDVLYVNLEPCSKKGKTPSCAGLILQKGIKYVVYGVGDPGQSGIQELRDAGVEVIGPVFPETCRRQNRGFFSIQEQGRPWITIKSAQTVKGEFEGKITSKQQDEWVHKHLRASHDAILVGVETILTDDPLLTTRHGFEDHLNYRIILDPKLRTPLDASIVNTPLADRTIIVTTNATLEYAEVLKKRGVRMWEIPLKDGLFDFDVLWKHCLTVTDDFFGIKSILVEGGPTTWTTFRLEGQRDEEVVLVG